MADRNSCLNEAQWRDLLSGAVNALSLGSAEAHLSACAACRARLDTMFAGNGGSPSFHPTFESGTSSQRLRELMDRLKHFGETIRLGAPPTNPLGAKLRYLGDYEIMEEIGRGGMGVVYRARQVSLRRDVALKVILSGQLASPSDVRRFHVEAEAAAKLDHPNIVPIFEIGEHDGHHFFSMKLVEGGSLAERRSAFWVSGFGSADMPSRAEVESRNIQLANLIATIARAIHYAHQRGVLHRDLKPHNILLDRGGQPHVTDFGLAKLIEHDSSLTHSAAVMGSPNYMAPELAAGHAREATIAADVYSLGAVLYELLTGEPPFKAATVPATLQKVVEEEPVRPRLLNRLVPADLETICLKCLEKDPQRRYGDARALAEDVERFVRGEPILARAATRCERAGKWVRRKPALAGSLAALALVFALGLTGVVWKWRGEIASRKLAQQESRRAQRAVTRLEIERAESLLAAEDSSRGLAYLARLLRQQPTNRVVAERLMSALTSRSFCVPVAPLKHGSPLDSKAAESSEMHKRFAFQRAGSVVAVNFSADGTRIVTASRDGTAGVWDAHSGEAMGAPLRHDAEVLWAQFDAEGARVVTASVDGSARIWSAMTGELAGPALRHDNVVYYASFSPDGVKVATACRDKRVRVWNARTGQLLRTMTHSKFVYFVAFSPDGQWILSADEDNRAYLWSDGATNRILVAEHFHFRDSPAPYPPFSPSSEQVVTFRWHNARLRNVRTFSGYKATLRHNSFVIGATFSPDGNLVATVSSDASVGLWDAVTGETAYPSLRHSSGVYGAQFTGDGRQLVTGSRDKCARVWEVRTGRLLAEPMQHEFAVSSARPGLGGQRVATIAESDSAWLWDVRVGQPLAILSWLETSPKFARFSPDGQRLLVADEADRVRVLDIASAAYLTKTVKPAATYTLSDARFSRDGRLFVTAMEDGKAQVWDASTGAPAAPVLRHAKRVQEAYFSPDATRLFTCVEDGFVVSWKLDTGEREFEVRHDAPARGMDLSPDGRVIATASEDGTARLWDGATGGALGEPLRHDDKVYSVAFDSAGGRVVTTSKDKTARIWSVATGKMLTPPLQHADAMHTGEAACFSPDGKFVVTSSGSAAQLWNANTGRATTTVLRHGGAVRAIDFSPDGRRIVTASEDGSVRLWDVETGHPVSEPLRHGSRVTHAEFSPDGLFVISCASDKGLRLWEVVSAPSPAQAWLPELAEALAGQRIDAEDVSSVVPVEKLFALRQQLAKNADSSDYGRWARWFFQNGATRAVSPSSPLSVPDYVQRRVAEDTRQSLEEATLLSPTNALAYARLARELAGTNRLIRTSMTQDADWFSRYATNLAPNSAEVQEIRASIVPQLNFSNTRTRR